MRTIELSVGSKALEVSAVNGRIALSEPFEIAVSAFAHEDAPACADLLGQTAVLTIHDPFERTLVVHGLVASVERSAGFEGLTHFTLSIGSGLLPLSIGRNSRVFTEVSAVDIVKKVLEKAGIPASDTRWELAGSYPVRAYCAQYRETDWAFIHRLLAEEGIYVWFDLGDERTVAVFADDSTAAQAIEGGAEIPFHEGGGLRATGDSVRELARATELCSDAVRLRDYHFDKPRLELDAKAGAGEREVYDYPGRFRVPAEGDRLARVRLEALRARRLALTGVTSSTRLRPGLVFALTEHPVAALNASYLVESITFGGSDARQAQGSQVELRFRAIPVETPYRKQAARVTSRPGGPQTGVVVGPSGEEIYPDKSGRVRVQLYWDREGARDEKASTWMRVGQFALGGSMILPRIGWDMLVGFEEGDADFPFVQTHLYDGQHPVPYALPANKTRSAWQTATTPGGGSTNELRFEDKAGSEEMFINASKDMNVVIGHDKSETVGVNHTHQIGSNLTTTIGSNLKEGIGASQTVSVGGSESVTISGNRGATIGGSETSTIGGSRTVTVSQGYALDATGGRTLVVGGSMMGTAALGMTRLALGTISYTVGGAWINVAGAGLANMTAGAYAETVGGAKIHAGASGCGLSVKGAAAETVGGAYVIAAGGNVGETATSALAITVGGAMLGNAPTIEIEADSAINIRCGATSVTIKSGSVEFKSPTLASPAAKIDKGASAIHHN
jgi:type VI secretion system secreted protein VgrG